MQSQGLSTWLTTPHKKWDVVVVGAGIIGCSAAYELAGRGLKVAVIDRGAPGAGCSYGNAGWVTPCFAMPLPMPGMLLKSIGWMLNPESPLYIQPRPSLLLFRWLMRFLFSMNQKHLDRSVRVLTQLSHHTVDFYSALDTAWPNRMSFAREGLLMVGQTPQGRKAAENEMKLVADHGIPGRVLSSQEVRDFEPALIGKTEGGVFFPNEAMAEPLAVIETLVHASRERGVHFINGAELLAMNEVQGKIESLTTTKGLICADRFVLATGTWSTAIAKSLGLRVPILGGKGYAMIVPKLSPNPRRPIMLIEKKIAVTPRADSLRIAGTLELVNQNFSITERRVNAILKGAREFLNVPEKVELRELWRGLRPCTPDGVPIISSSAKLNNLFISTGHQMLGLQSAGGSARLLTQLMFNESPSVDPAPFRADRFV